MKRKHNCINSMNLNSMMGEESEKGKGKKRKQHKGKK